MISNITLSSGEKISLISNLSTMLTAGIPILDAVNSLMEDTKGHLRQIFETLRDDLMQGKHIHDSLATFPKAFDKVTINLIKASEEAGTLEVTLKDLADHIQKEVEFYDKVKFALIYPVFIMIIFVAVLLVILIFVIPKISTVFSRLRVELPLPTKILVFSSNILVNHTLPLIIGIVAFTALLVLIYRVRKQFILNLIFSLPLVSQLIQEIDLTRFTRSLHLLLSSGLPIAVALELCQDVVVKKSMSNLIAHSREMVVSGHPFSAGLRDNKLKLPSIVIKLTEAGEKSGTLDKSMQDISTYLDYQVSNTLKTLTAALEPVMLLVVGLSVGGMMMAIIAPIYGLIGQVGGR